MSAPRPCVTDPVHPLSSISNKYAFPFINQSVLAISSMWYVQVCLSYVTYLAIAHVLFKNTRTELKKEMDYSSYVDLITATCWGLLTQNA